MSEKWATDESRVVWVRWNAAQAKRCTWTLKKDGMVTETKTTDCNPKYEQGNLCPPAKEQSSNCFKVLKDTNYELTVVAEGETRLSKTTLINVDDVSFVALGDSFSSGEGVPHMQWRVLGKTHPTVWWDGRCNRSLLSGPSLSAAIYSRQNKQISVTLMHYGCSGASVDDGIVRPWKGLETSDRVQKRQNNAIFKFLGYNTEEKDIQSCIGKETLHIAAKPDLATKKDYSCRPEDADILPSQIAMAAHDLDRESEKPNDFPESFSSNIMRPDYVLISAGGNDIGFGPIVTSMAVSAATPFDLRPNRDYKEDRREFVSTDQNRFNEANYEVSRLIKSIDNNDEAPITCTKDNPDPENATSCFLRDALTAAKKEKVNNRISTIANAHYRISTDIPGGYAKLFSEVNSRLNPDKVIVTRYPSALTYRKKPDSLEFEFCEDRTLDGKPGLVPSPINAFRGLGLGVQEKYAKLGDKFILNHLNQTINNTLENLKSDQLPTWIITSESAFEITKPFGYCNVEAKTFNTIVDSIFFQGLSPKTNVPIGTVYDNRMGSKVKSSSSWDVIEGRYKYLREAGRPAVNDTVYPNIPSEREGVGKSGIRYEHDRNKPENISGSGVLPTGPFHPTVLGSCMYVLALMEQIDPSNTNLGKVTENSILVNGSSITKEAGWEKDAIKEVCSAKAFGYQRVR